MTVIFTTSDFWIESFDIVRTTVAPGAQRVSVLSIDKSGRFVGGAITGDADGGIIFYQIRHVDNSFIAYGDVVNNSGGSTGIEAIGFNNDGVNREVGIHVILFIRK